MLKLDYYYYVYTMYVRLLQDLIRNAINKTKQNEKEVN